MSAPKVTVEDNPDPGLRAEILKPLRAFNESKVGALHSQHLAIVLRDPDCDAVIGGLWGYSVADWLYVDLLIVPEQFRNQGIGTSLMKQAEKIARARNCVGVWLHTGTFQAPEFYQKVGYHPFGAIDDYPRGHRTIYFCKRLEC